MLELEPERLGIVLHLKLVNLELDVDVELDLLDEHVLDEHDVDDGGLGNRDDMHDE